MKIVFRESGSASDKISCDTDFRSHGEYSCANPRRLGLCFCAVPESDQAYRASLAARVPGIPQREILFVARRVMGLTRMDEARDLLFNNLHA